MAVNQALVVGNLGRDPEIRSTQSGEKVASFSVATTEKWTDRNGEKKERTEWHNVVVWGGLVDALIAPHVKKGSKVLVQAPMRTRKWTDQNGVDRYTTEIVFSGPGCKFELLGSAQGGGNRPPPADESSYGAQPKSNAPRNYAEDLNDDIPF